MDLYIIISSKTKCGQELHWVTYFSLSLVHGFEFSGHLAHLGAVKSIYPIEAVVLSYSLLLSTIDKLYYLLTYVFIYSSFP